MVSIVDLDDIVARILQTDVPQSQHGPHLLAHHSLNSPASLLILPLLNDVALRIVPRDGGGGVAGDLHHPLHHLPLVPGGLVQGGVAIVPHPQEALILAVHAHKLFPVFLVVRMIHHQASVGALILLVDIPKDQLLLHNLEMGAPNRNILGDWIWQNKTGRQC